MSYRQSVLELLIKGDNRDAVAALKGAKTELHGLGEAAQGASRLLGMVGAGLSVRAGIQQIDRLIDRMDGIAKAAARTGASTGEFQRLTHAANLSGASAGDLEQAMRNLSRVAVAGGAAGEAAFERVGLTLDAIKGKRPDEIFRLVASGIAAIENPTERSAAAVELFGRSGTSLLPMLDNLDELAGKLDEINGVINDESLAAAEAFNDAITELKASLQSLVANSGLIPWLADAIDLLNQGNNLRAQTARLENSIKGQALGQVADMRQAFANRWEAQHGPADTKAKRKAQQRAFMDQMGGAVEATQQPVQAAEAEAAAQAAAAKAAAESRRLQAEAAKAAEAAEKAYAKAAEAAAKELARLHKQEADQFRSLAEAEADRAQAADRTAELAQIDAALDAKEREIRLAEQAAKALRDQAAAAKDAAAANFRAVALGQVPAAAPAAERRAAREAAAEERQVAAAEADLAEARRRQERGFRNFTPREQALIDADDARREAKGIADVAAGEQVKADRAAAEVDALQADRDRALAKFAEQDFAAKMDREHAKLEEIRAAIAALGVVPAPAAPPAPAPSPVPAAAPAAGLPGAASLPAAPPAPAQPPDAAAALATAWDGAAPPPVQVTALAPPPVAVQATAPAPVQVEAIAPPPVQVTALAPPPVQVEAVAPPPVAVQATAPPPVAVQAVAPAPVQVEAIAPPPVAVQATAPAPVQVTALAPPPVQVAAVAPPPVQVTALAPPPVRVQIVQPSAVPLAFAPVPRAPLAAAPAPVAASSMADNPIWERIRRECARTADNIEKIGVA
jgi:hypothetical protein